MVGGSYVQKNYTLSVSVGMVTVEIRRYLVGAGVWLHTASDIRAG
jgi:hypothetical protein